MKNLARVSFCLMTISGVAYGNKLADLGVDFNKASNIAVTPEWEKAFSESIQLTQDQHGCRYATRKNIYAFEDGAVYLKDDRSSFNAVDAAKVLSKGCYLPNQEFVSGYTGIRPLRPETQKNPSERFISKNMTDFGLILDGMTRNAPDTISDAIRHGIRFTQRQVGCGESALPFVYAYADGLLFVDGALTQVQANSLELAGTKGCKLPDVKPGSAGNFARLINPNEVMATLAEQSAASSDSYIDGDSSKQLCTGKWSWLEKTPIVTVRGLPKSQAKLAGKMTFKDYQVTDRLAPAAQAIPLEIQLSKFIIHNRYNDTVITDEDVKSVRDECTAWQNSLVDQFATVQDTAPVYIEKTKLDETTGSLITSYESNTIKELCADQLKIREFDDYYGKKSLAYADICRPFEKDNLLTNYTKDAGSFLNLAPLVYRKSADRSPVAVPGEVYGREFKFASSTEATMVKRYNQPKGDVAYQATWFTATFSCKATVRPRLIVPQVNDQVAYTELKPEKVCEINKVDGCTPCRDEVGKLCRPLKVADKVVTIDYLIQRYTNDQLNLTKSELLTKNPDSPIFLAPDTQAAISEQNLSTEDTNLPVVDPKSLIREKTTFTCSSGDHLPVTNRAQALERFRFQKASIRNFILSADIVEYYTKGYCKAGEPCKLEYSPELEAILRKTQAMGVEKFSFLSDPEDPARVTPEIADLEALGQQFPESYFPEQKPGFDF